MDVHGFPRFLAIIAILVSPSGWAFNYAQYKSTDLDEILRRPRPESGAQALAPQKLRLDVTLVAYASDCNTAFLKAMMLMLGARKEVVDGLPISKCIDVRSAKGEIVSMYIQDRVAEHLPKEVPLGKTLTLFSDLLFIDKNGPGLLVNDFQAKKR